MPSLVETAGLRHIASLKAQAGVTAVYRRGVEETADITVVPAIRNVTIENQEGMLFQGRARDIVVEAKDLVINLVTILPKEFDQVHLKNEAGDVVEKLQVNTSPAYDNSDGYGVIFRIHVIQIPLA